MEHKGYHVSVMHTKDSLSVLPCSQNQAGREAALYFYRNCSSQHPVMTLNLTPSLVDSAEIYHGQNEAFAVKFIQARLTIP